MDPVDANLHYVARDGARSVSGLGWTAAWSGDQGAITTLCPPPRQRNAANEQAPHDDCAEGAAGLRGAGFRLHGDFAAGMEPRTPVSVNIPAYFVMACGR